MHCYQLVLLAMVNLATATHLHSQFGCAVVERSMDGRTLYRKGWEPQPYTVI